MKKIMVCLLISVVCPLTFVMAGTNDYNATLTGEIIEQRLAAVTNLQERMLPVEVSITNLQTAVYSGGLADIWFGSTVISAAFTNANFAVTDLSAYVGTNVAMVTLQFKGIAASTVSLRTYGDTNTVDDTSMNSVAIAAGSTATMTVLTDSAGQVDVKATGNTSMTLIAFIRRHIFE